MQYMYIRFQNAKMEGWNTFTSDFGIDNPKLLNDLTRDIERYDHIDRPEADAVYFLARTKDRVDDITPEVESSRLVTVAPAIPVPTPKYTAKFGVPSC